MIWRRQQTKIFRIIIVIIIILTCPYFLLVYETEENQRFWAKSVKEDKFIKDRMFKMKERLYDSCVFSDKGMVRYFYTHEEKHMTYCPVAKIGSTFWLRVFLFLHRDTGPNVNNPYDIPRFYVHYGPKKYTKSHQFDESMRSILSNLTRFMFVRDPYSRLWSAYLDKFVLPDFWRSDAIKIVTRRKGDQKLKSKICNHDVTFQEFLKYIISIQDSKTLNEHWRPIHLMCNPCDFRPHFIGKQETFSQDMNFILEYFNITNIFSAKDTQYQKEEELKTLIVYNFKLLERKEIKRCLTPKELAVRLWKVFEFNGYLPFESSHLLGDAENITSGEFIDIVLKVQKSTPKSRNQWKLQRLSAMKSAYKSVPSDIIRGIQALFHLDFVHFDYSPDPPS